MVDASKDDEKIITSVKEEDLPVEMKGMNADQRKAYIKQKANERNKIQAEIMELNAKRQEYITTHTPQAEKDQMLDAAMIKAIKQRASEKDLRWE